MISAIVSEPNKVKIYNPIEYDSEGNVTLINSCAFQSGYFSKPELIKETVFWIDTGDKAYLNDYEESNLPKPLAKARAMEFLLNYFQNNLTEVTRDGE